MQPDNAPYLMSTTERPDPVMVRGSGSVLWDKSGRAYLDFMQGWATNSLGHAALEVTRAITEQASLLVTASPALFNEPLLDLARRLSELTGLKQACLSCTGAEANECAIKLARKWGRLHRGGAYEIISTHGAFHGRTLATMAASGKPGWEALFPPNPPGFVKVPFGDVEAVRAAICERTAAVLVEPIQGEGGVVVPETGYLRQLRQLTSDLGILLVFDEVQTGVGRTGRLFAHEWENVTPDLLTVGKGLGGGVPIAATLAAEHACCFAVGDQGGTFHGAPLACRVALAVLDVVADSEFLASVRARGEQLGQGLGRLVARHGLVESRGRGLLHALQLGSPSAARVRHACLQRGLLVNAPAADLIRFMPSLRVSKQEVDQMLAIVDRVIGEID
jgi:acetylornithine/N-succinyldiaminopimelate aminotransferase